jgi:hypothetical protein
MNRSDAGKLGWEKSKKYHLKIRAATRKAYDLCPKKCKLCHVKLKYSQRGGNFCSHGCAACFNNGRRTRIVKSSCVGCDRKVRGSNIWCSKDCRKKTRWERAKALIVKSGCFPSKTSYIAKKFIKERDGFDCKICGLGFWLGQVLPLILDHIDGNSDNWRLDNLRLICSNCDSLTPTYKGRNRGNGRAYRRARYAKGQSY